MFKMFDRLCNHWEKMRFGNEWWLWIVVGEIVVFMVLPLGIFYMIAPYIGKIPCFSGVKCDDIAYIMWIAFGTLIMITVGAWLHHSELEEKNAKQRLQNRELSEYVKKYQKYVDFVKSALQEEQYKELHLLEDWVKTFDQNIDKTARLRDDTEQQFIDFEVIACLMYALTSESAKDSSAINVAFALLCAKTFLHKPSVYRCKRIEGEELILEQRESLKEVSFENINDSNLFEVQELVGVYLSQREFYSQILELADFLHIFYLRCDK